MTGHTELLTPSQREIVASRVGPTELIADMSWAGSDVAVLHVRAPSGDYVVKASPAAHHHLDREITAFEGATKGLSRGGRAAELVAADRAAGILILTYQPGSLVEGTPAELRTEIHAQAGAMLSELHRQWSRIDDEDERRVTAKALHQLDTAHRIAPDDEQRAREILRGYRPEPVTVVPTHGDWQPRNWLLDGARLRVIDFGRFDIRPASTDLCRLAAQQWRTDPALERAFLTGYGSDPRDPRVWPMDLLREAIATAVWAHRVGDTAFEAQGHRMLREALTWAV